MRYHHEVMVRYRMTCRKRFRIVMPTMSALQSRAPSPTRPSLPCRCSASRRRPCRRRPRPRGAPSTSGVRRAESVTALAVTREVGHAPRLCHFGCTNPAVPVQLRGFGIHFLALQSVSGTFQGSRNPVIRACLQRSLKLVASHSRVAN